MREGVKVGRQRSDAPSPNPRIRGDALVELRQRPQAAPDSGGRTALQQYLHTFFGGSLRQMVTALVREGSWDEGDLEALRSEIDRVRKEKKP